MPADETISPSRDDTPPEANATPSLNSDPPATGTTHSDISPTATIPEQAPVLAPLAEAPIKPIASWKLIGACGAFTMFLEVIVWRNNSMFVLTLAVLAGCLAGLVYVALTRWFVKH